jgi:hypothetical protein
MNALLTLNERWMKPSIPLSVPVKTGIRITNYNHRLTVRNYLLTMHNFAATHLHFCRSREHHLLIKLPTTIQPHTFKTPTAIFARNHYDEAISNFTLNERYFRQFCQHLKT